MFIQTEDTPNPSTLKFLPGQVVLDQGAADFASAEAAQVSPLAQRLFSVAGVCGVLLGHDFITVTKAEDRPWSTMKAPLLSAIMEFFLSSQPVLAENTQAQGHAESNSQDPVILQIKELLDTRIRPAVAQDGGDIVFQRFDSGVVYLTMKGACAGCPSSTATLKSGIENMLRHYIPEVTEVRAA